ncbi:MAG: ABC transporter permease, partial [Clostridia bacterium]
MNSAFLTSTNLLNILKQAATVSVVAIGMTFTLISGGLDLSAGSVIALAGVCSAKFGLPDGPNIIVPICVAISVGMACGLVNGVIIAKGKVPPFIVTLGMSLSARGMALLVTNAMPVFGLSKAYTYMGSGKIGPIPVIVIVMFVVLIIATIILEKTKFGRHIYAVGGNELAAHVSGIRVDRVKIMAYVIMGAMTGLCGMLLAGRIQSGTPTMGEGYELDAIAGAVIGGVSSAGGVGKVYGAVVGSLMLAMISNGLDLLNVSAYYQQIIKGAIIVTAVLLDVKTKGTKK